MREIERAAFEGAQALASSAVRLARGDGWVAEMMLNMARSVMQSRREEGRRGCRERDAREEKHDAPGQPVQPGQPGDPR